MTPFDLRQLAVLSVKDPARAADTLLANPVPRQTLWIVLALIAVLNALLFSLSNVLVPGPVPFPGLFEIPLVYCVIVAGALLLLISAFYWVGRALGGTGSFDDLLQTILWLQTLRLIVQAAALVLVLVIPLLSALLVFAASLYGVYMLLHFLNQAHRLNSIGRSAIVVIASMLAIVFGLTLIISLFGGPIAGSFAYV